MIKHNACLLVMMATLAACDPDEGSPQERMVPNRSVGSILSDTVVGTAEGAWAAVQSPFEDVNLKQQEIPAQLLVAAANPYALPTAPLCQNLREEVATLDVLLGPDVRGGANTAAVAESRRGEYIEEGAGVARDQALGIVRTQTNIIPFRGMVRKLSGAERHAKEVERAYQAGRLRRAFLKGIAIPYGPDCLGQK